MTGTAEVVVVGAGPAGCAAAVTLAAAGVDCVLVDKARFPRDKCCGDGLTTAGLRHLEQLGLDPATVPSFTPLARLSFRAPSGRLARVPLPSRPGIFGAVARRSELDAALVARAAASGAATRLGEGVAALAIGNDELELGLEGGDALRARYVVAADGAWSPLRRMASGAGPSGARRGPEWIAFRAYAEGVGPEAAAELWVCFEPALLPGYAWSFPLAGGTANVGVYLRRSATVRGHELAATWEEVLEGPFMRSLLGPGARLGPSKSWPIPAGMTPRELTAANGRLLFAGDAAWAADPFTGEGIAQALHSGIAAAAAFLGNAAAGPQSVAAAYRSAMAATIGRDQRVARWCSALMSTPAGAGAAVALTSATRWTRASSARWLFEDYARGAALSPRAWRAVRHPGPGPYAGEALSSPGWRRVGARGR